MQTMDTVLDFVHYLLFCTLSSCGAALAINHIMKLVYNIYFILLYILLVPVTPAILCSAAQLHGIVICPCRQSET